MCCTLLWLFWWEFASCLLYCPAMPEVCEHCISKWLLIHIWTEWQVPFSFYIFICRMYKKLLFCRCAIMNKYVALVNNICWTVLLHVVYRRRPHQGMLWWICGLCSCEISQMFYLLSRSFKKSWAFWQWAYYQYRFFFFALEALGREKNTAKS